MSDIKDLKPTRNGRYKQGYINPSSCNKLIKGINNDIIIYRSSYELKFITWLENNNQVKQWGSECICIPYTYIDNKIHHYYPDYFVEFVDGTKMVVEVKPLSQTRPPISEANQWGKQAYIKNMCKWRATKEFCESKGYKFKIITEKTINQI